MSGEFEIFIKVLLGIAAAIVAIGGAVGVIEHVSERVSMKTNRVAQQVNDHEKELERHAQYLDNDNQRLKDMEMSNKLIMRGLMQLITHSIDGNHVDLLEKARDDINKYLIER